MPLRRTSSFTHNSPMEFVVLCHPLLPVREQRLTEVKKLAPRQTHSNVRPGINLGGLASKRMHAFLLPQLFVVLGSWAEPGYVGLGPGDPVLAIGSEAGVRGSEQKGVQLNVMIKTPSDV